MDIEAAREFILAELRQKLRPDRSYHSLEHTLDVYTSTTSIAQQEGVAGDGMGLLKTAALFHDSGFLNLPEDHEAGSCLLVQEHLPQFGYTDAQIDQVCKMIMATKIPQTPQDSLSNILCDADLDYLGRPDFHRIGHLLFLEMKHHGQLSTEREWYELQERFLAGHHYFTATCQQRREPMKQKHLAEIRAWLAKHP